MRRIVAVLVALTLALLAALLATEAQPVRTVRIGWLASVPVPSDFEPFRQALRELGYVEGRNLVIEQRYGSGGRQERYQELAADLVRLSVDVIVSTGIATEAARRATATIPIVCVFRRNLIAHSGRT